MKTTLKIVASRAMDQFYQNYAPRDAFFDIDDFKFHFATIYTTMFDNAFQQFRKMGKAEDGFSNVEITSNWLVTEEVTAESDKNSDIYFVSPSSCIFGFGWDEFSYSLDNFKPVGHCGCKLQKISRQESHYLDISPTTSLCYYWVEANNKIAVTNKVTGLITYVPAVDSKNENCVMSDLIVADVIKMTLDLFFKAKSGNVIDKTNDNNANNNIEGQSNPSLIKIQQR